MKKYYIIYAFFAAAVLLSASCKKYINEGPISSTYDANFWTSETSANQATLAMYKQLRGCLRDENVDYGPGMSHFIFGDLVSGLFVCSEWNYGSLSTTGQFKFTDAAYLTYSLHNWSRFYQLITQCNLVQERVPQMSTALFESEAAKNRYVGEALFMRAFTYFYITRIWGDPIYIDKTFSNVDYGKIPPIARTPEAKVLDNCINDLKKAIEYLPEDGTTIRATKGAAHALMAHIYAWKHDYANAHLACEEVYKYGYGLEPMATYTNIWKGVGSAENIFELPMKANENGTEETFGFFGAFLKDGYVDNEKDYSWVGVQDVIEGLYTDPNDKRFSSILSLVPTATGGVKDPAGYVLLKYTDFNYKNDEPYVNNNLSLFRLADILLLDAEALLATGNNAGAIEKLNKVRQRAGIADYADPGNDEQFANDVLDERLRELIGEGQVYYDMIRTNESTKALSNRLGFTSNRIALKGYYWPLDMGTLFKDNLLLTQNPWWAVAK